MSGFIPGGPRDAHARYDAERSVRAHVRELLGLPSEARITIIATPELTRIVVEIAKERQERTLPAPLAAVTRADLEQLYAA